MKSDTREIAQLVESLSSFMSETLGSIPKAKNILTII